MLRLAWDMSKSVVCANFMSSYVDYELDKNFHFDPSDTLRFVKSLSRFVSLYHDYDLWEFTVQIHHRPTLTI